MECCVKQRSEAERVCWSRRSMMAWKLLRMRHGIGRGPRLLAREDPGKSGAVRSTIRDGMVLWLDGFMISLFHDFKAGLLNFIRAIAPLLTMNDDRLSSKKNEDYKIVISMILVCFQEEEEEDASSSAVLASDSHLKGEVSSPGGCPIQIEQWRILNCQNSAWNRDCLLPY